MTKRELIEALADYPDDAPVCICSNSRQWFQIAVIGMHVQIDNVVRPGVTILIEPEGAK